MTEVIEELNAMDINNLEDLDKLLYREFIDKYLKMLRKWKMQSNWSVLLRIAMLSKDAEKYFTRAWNKHYTVTSRLVNEMKSLGVDVTGVKSFPGVISD